MQCKTCQYPLWNLRTRTCPECGSPFTIESYEFVPNTVQFQCPHCSQAYYGTDSKGHLVPQAFHCVKCQQPITMEETVVLPAPGRAEFETQPIELPWAHRRGRSLRSAWYKTIYLGMFKPHLAARALTPGDGAATAVRFAGFNALVVVVIGGLLPALMLLVLDAVANIGGMTGLAGALGVFALIVCVTTAVGVFLWSAIAHLVLRVTGKTQRDFSATLQAICYSSGPLLFLGVPCLGPHLFFFIGGIWWVIIAIYMIMEVQKTSGFRATMAGITFPILLILAMVVAYGTLMYIALSATNAARAGGPPTGFVMPGGNAQPISSQLELHEAMLEWAEDHDGRLPRHAAELLLGGGGRVWQFILDPPQSATTLEDVPLSDVTLSRYQSLLAGEKRVIIEHAVSLMPESAVAYRLGDVVITCPGMMIDELHDDLWLLILCPDPEHNSPPPSITIITVDGEVRTWTRNELWDAALSAENAAREAAGLEPLIDPWLITHAQPQLAAPAPAVP